MARFTYGNMNYSEGEPIMNNLTEKEKHVNTYSHFIAIRILSIFVCILLAAAYSPGNVNNFFVSYYDTFMIREIFTCRHPANWSAACTKTVPYSGLAEMNSLLFCRTRIFRTEMN